VIFDKDRCGKDCRSKAAAIREIEKALCCSVQMDRMGDVSPHAFFFAPSPNSKSSECEFMDGRNLALSKIPSLKELKAIKKGPRISLSRRQFEKMKAAVVMMHHFRP